MFKNIWIAFVVVIALGCATTRYKPPMADRQEVWAEYNRQRSKRDSMQKEAFRVEIKEDKERFIRLTDLAFPVRLAAALLSDRNQLRTQFGFNYYSLGSLNPDVPWYKKEVLVEEFDIELEYNLMSVWFVIKGSPADKAGMRTGDRIFAIEGKHFSFPETFNSPEEFDKQLESAKRFNEPVKFHIKRDSTQMVLEMRPITISNYHVSHIYESGIQALADGKAVYVTTGMMDFASDIELQFVIAHELAHNIERHLEKRKNNAIVGAILGGFLDGLASAYTGTRITGFGQLGAQSGAFAYSKDFEREADYLGMYLLARAGIPTFEVSNFWRKISEISDDKYNRTHPTNAERFIDIMAIDQEIEKKRKEDQPLFPNK